MILYVEQRANGQPITNTRCVAAFLPTSSGLSTGLSNRRRSWVALGLAEVLMKELPLAVGVSSAELLEELMARPRLQEQPAS